MSKKEITLEELAKRLDANEKALKSKDKQIAELTKTIKAVEKSAVKSVNTGKRPKPTPSKYTEFQLTQKDGEGKVVEKTTYKIKHEYQRSNKMSNPLKGGFISVDDFVELVKGGDTSVAIKIIELCENSQIGYANAPFEPKK